MHRQLAYMVLFMGITCALYAQRNERAAPRTASQFITVAVPDRVIDSFKNHPAYWYADMVPAKETAKPENESSVYPQGFTTALWIFVGLVAAFVISSYVLGARKNIFRKTSSKIMAENVDHNTEHIFSINFDSEIKSAFTTGNYRNAIRLQYLQLLAVLHQRGLIEYLPEKTNHDYINELRSKNSSTDFPALTNIYNRYWYGSYPVTATEYQRVQEQFSAFKKELVQ